MGRPAARREFDPRASDRVSLGERLCQGERSMVVLQVFDPPMCCPTGVCGPKVNPAVTRFSADVHWLKLQGVRVERFNLAQEPGAFAKNPVVKQMLAQAGAACLPLILVDAHVVSRGVYPSREELMAFTGVVAQQPAGGIRPSFFDQPTARGRQSFPQDRGGGCCGGSECRE